MIAQNRTQEVLKLLSGHYEVVPVNDGESGSITLRFWLCRPVSDGLVSPEGLRFFARFNGKTYDFIPERLTVSRTQLGMRIRTDAVPQGWLGECEIVCAQTYRCFPFKGVVDITDALLPTRRHQESSP